MTTIQQEIQYREWKPHPKQVRFLEIPDTIFEGLYGGAAGGGKSEVLLMLPIVRGLYENPYFKGILFRRTFPELEKSLILRSNDFYPATGAKYNSQIRRWRFPSGAVVDFGYAEYENDVRRYDTTEYNYMGFDELTSFTEFQYTYLISRCRTARSDLPAIVRGGTNPGNVGHGWVRKRFVDPDRNGFKILIDPIIKTKRIFIPAKLTDNPHLMQHDPDYINRLELLPESDRRAKLEGDWWTFIGQVFDEWRTEPFKGEPANARHVIDPFPVPDFWPQILCIDWGYTAMLAAYWLAIAPDGRVYVIDEYISTQEKNSTWGPNLALKSQNRNVKLVIMGRDAWSSHGDEKTIADQFADFSGFMPVPADTDRIGGKALLQEYIRWKPKSASFVAPEDYKEDTAQYILRNHGLEAYKEYLRRFEPEKPETNLPKLQVFSTCTKLIDTIPLCVYPALGTTQNRQKQEDVAEFIGDDPYDALRYGIKAVDHYVSESKSAFQQLSERQAVVNRLKETGDTTDFYRQMADLDAKKYGAQAVRRFHGASRMVN